MASNFEEQIKLYTMEKQTEHKKLKEQSKQDPPKSVSNSSNQIHSTNPTNEPTNSLCSRCWQLVLTGNSSFEVMTLPVLGGVPLHIHSFWLMFVLLSSLGALQVSGLFAIYALVLGGPVLFGTVLIHELGHAAMAVRLGGQVSRILLWPLGGLAYISFFGETNPKADALVAIAGPLTHFPQAAVWAALMAVSNGGVVRLSWPIVWGWDFWLAVCAGALSIQLVLFLFNLIPAYPLDGGRLFGALLQQCGVDRNKTFQISAGLGFVSFNCGVY